MSSTSTVTKGLALALSCVAVGVAWAGVGPSPRPLSVTIEEGERWEPALRQGQTVTFEVAEGWDGRSSVDCVRLLRGSRWTFEIQDIDGDGELLPTSLPGFVVAAPGTSLSVSGGALSGFCAQDADEDGRAELYAHLIVENDAAVVTLAGVSLDADTSALPAETPRVGIYGAAGSVGVLDQVVSGLPFSAVKLIGGTFIQEGGRYDGVASSAVVAADSTVSLNGVTFTGGTGDRGAGVNVEGGLLLVYGSVFEGGRAMSYGGAIAAQDATVLLTDVQVLNNHAVQGGGVWARGGAVTVSGGELTGNVADESGGGLYAQGAAVELRGARLTSNFAVFDGGGAYVTGEDALLTLSEATELVENDAGDYGGGVFVDGAALSGSALSARGNGASFGGALGARDSAWVDLVNVQLNEDVASLKGGGLYLQEVGDARLCDLQVSGDSATLSGGVIYAIDSALTMGAEDGSCKASAIVGAVAPEGAALTFIDTSAAPDGVGLSVAGLALTQLNPDGDGGALSEDQAIFASTSGAVTLRGLTTPGGLGPLALLTAVEAEVTLHDLELLDVGITSLTQFAAVQQPVLRLTRPASVDLQGAQICGFVAEGGSFGLVQVDAPAGDVVIARNALYGAQAFEGLVRVVPDDSGLNDAEITLSHNSLIGAPKDSPDGAFLRGGRIVATGNLLHRLGVGLILDGASGESETYNLFSDAVVKPHQDGGGKAVRVDDSSTDEVAELGLVPAFNESSCFASPELLEESPAVNGGDPAGERDPDGSIADQGALPVTLTDTDQDGSFDVDDCAPTDPTIGDTLPEIYGDGIDNDCDPETQDDDQDGDGLLRGVDCDDADPSPCPPVSRYSGGCAGWGCAATPGAPALLWLAPLALLIGRRRRRQERR